MFASLLMRSLSIVAVGTLGFFVGGYTGFLLRPAGMMLYVGAILGTIIGCLIGYFMSSRGSKK